MAKKKTTVTNAMRMLTAAGIHFDTVEYEAEEVTKNFGAYIAGLTGIPPEQSFKTLVGKGDKTGVVVAVIPVEEELDLKRLAAVSGNKRVELVAVKDIQGLTGYIRGGVSPVGMKKKFPTYICESCKSYERIAISGGICGITLMLPPADLAKVTDGVYERITL
ncbi:MAG: Cys-tRNA(Pro) deacylase [Clostridia bacterium]|nr:Cys-tRNA(Pro) deacylase [Clostridia bacterium]